MTAGHVACRHSVIDKYDLSISSPQLRAASLVPGRTEGPPVALKLLGVSVEMGDGLSKKCLARDTQDVARRWVAVETDSRIVHDQDSIEDMLEDGSELLVSSAGGGVGGPLLYPDDAEVQGKDQHTKADADEQSRDKSCREAGLIDSCAERNNKKAYAEKKQEEGAKAKPKWGAVHRREGRAELQKNSQCSPGPPA